MGNHPGSSPGDRTKTSEQSYLLRFFYAKKSSLYRLLLLFRQNTVLTSSSFGFFILVVFFYCFRDFKLLRNLTATQFEPVFRCTLKLRFRCLASPSDRTKTSEQSYLLRFFYSKNLRLTACSSFSSKATAFSDLCLRHSMLICLKNFLFKRIQNKLSFLPLP